MTSTKTSLLLTPLLAGLLAATLGACGDGNAGADGGTGAAGGRSAEVADDKAQLAFARCLRERGIEVADPDGSGGLKIQLKGQPGEKGAMTPRRLQDATKECREKTGGGPPEPTEAEKTEMRDSALKFAKCMREHGIDMPDPQFEGGGAVIGRVGPGDGGGGIDPASPAFQKAQEACQDLMPRLRRGDGPSTQTSSGSSAGDTGASADVAVPQP